MKAVVDIAITTDEHYMQHAGVMLASLFAHNVEVSFRVHLFSNAMRSLNYSKLRALVTGAGHQLRYIAVDTARLQHLKLSAHATTAVYYRLLIPELLDALVEKVLYLDCDLIVKDNLLPLWETPLGNYPVAAVIEPHFTRHNELGLPAHAMYFNSGVMLINLPVWRQKLISERAIAFLQTYPDKILYWDQDALNVVLGGDWLPLHPRWNQQPWHYEEEKHTIIMDREALHECLINPAVVHFSTKLKPWQYWCQHPLRGLYFDYLALTPWRDFRLTEGTNWYIFKSKIRKIISF